MLKKFADLLNLCETEPDRALEFLEKGVLENPEMESTPMFKFAKAIAYGSKGLFQMLCQKPELDLYTADPSELIKEFGLSNEHLDYLEMALKEIRKMEEIYPKHLETMCALGDEAYVLKVDTIAVLLEMCRPGRVHQILGDLKLIYFGNRKIGSIKDRPRPPSSLKEKIAYILNFCEFVDPDLGLKKIDSSEDLEFKSNPLTKFARALAYGSKGVLYQLHQRPEINIAAMGESELREELGLNSEQLDYLELALQEIREIERDHPGFMKSIDPMWVESKIDHMAISLERCRPGRVQQLLGKTKLLYFGHKRIMRYPEETVMENRVEDLPPEERTFFLKTFFSFRCIVRSALPTQYGEDPRGRKYIHCMLFERTPDDPVPSDTVAEAFKLVGSIYLFDDGTFSETLEKA